MTEEEREEEVNITVEVEQKVVEVNPETSAFARPRTKGQFRRSAHPADDRTDGYG